MRKALTEPNRRGMNILLASGGTFVLMIVVLLTWFHWSGVSEEPHPDIPISKHLDTPNTIVNGIDDAVTAIVECSTTQGNLTIDIRGNWAPIGSAQYLQLIDIGYFTNLPFYRVCPKYITQFGAKFKGNEKLNRAQVSVLRDDPTLWGVRDMDFGYLFYAGSGPDSRRNEMVVALCEMQGCRQSGLGHAPWEVPVGTIRREDGEERRGFKVLERIASSGFPYPKLEMPGQHPKAQGPSSHAIQQEEGLIDRDYPDIEKWINCHVQGRHLHQYRPLSLDHPESNQILKSSSSSSSTTTTTNSQQMNSDHNNNKNIREELINKPQENNQKQLSLSSSSSTKTKNDSENSNSFDVKMTVVTSIGEGLIHLRIYRDWAPLGSKRFEELIQEKFFNQAKFFRVLKNFMAQFGIAADPSRNEKWRGKASQILDDPDVGHSNERGTLSFAMAGPNTRSTQLFINTVNNKYLDKQGFVPIGIVLSGMSHVDALYNEYGEGGKGDGSDGRGPSQGRIQQEGNVYLDKTFPRLSFILNTEIIK